MAKNRILWQLVLFGKKIISLERSKAKLMVETNVKTSFADITAAEETKQKLQQIVDSPVQRFLVEPAQPPD